MTADNRFFPPFASRPRPPDSGLLRAGAGGEGKRLRTLLARTAPGELSEDAVRANIEGNLWMLTPEAFRYFLPAFLRLGVTCYDSLVSFVAELVSALTEPTRDDVVKAFDRAARIPASLGLPPETLQLLRLEQLEWFDSGAPVTMYRERVAGLSAPEQEAILDFLVAIREAHGGDFPFDELQIAIDRLRT